MSAVVRRDVAPYLKRVREFLLGRSHTLAVRFEDGVADRTQPPPAIPGGPAHKLSANYYTNRDPRRLVDHPINVGTTLIAAPGAGSDLAARGSGKLPIPGTIFKWD